MRKLANPDFKLSGLGNGFIVSADEREVFTSQFESQRAALVRLEIHFCKASQPAVGSMGGQVIASFGTTASGATQTLTIVVGVPAGTAGDLLSAIVGALVFLGIWRLIRR